MKSILRTNEIPNTTSKYIALDTEIFAMHKGKLHRPTGTFAALSLSDGETTWVITDQILLPLVIEAVKDKVWVMHNAAFDLFHLRRWVSIEERNGHDLWDTMVWERLMWNGYYDQFSLDALARRYLNVQMDKDIRKQFEKADHMTYDLIGYSAEDAENTFYVYQAQHAEAVSREGYTDLIRLWVDLEAPMIEVLQKFKGFKLNVTAWESIADGYQSMRDDIKATMNFNPASPQQVLKALRARGINVKNTQASTLEDYKDDTVVAKVLRFRKAAKLAGTYGHKFLEKHLDPDGKIYSNYRSIGALTGRSASRDPNMQNIPHDQVFRDSFVASPGNKLVIADYSQQEIRVTAFHAKDERLLEILERGGDTHLETARLIFRDDNIQKSDHERYIGKTVNLAIIYGLTAYNLALRVTNYYSQIGEDQSMSVPEAQRIIDSYFRTFPGVKEFIDHQRWLASRNMFVTTEFGRVAWVNPYNKQWMNNAINSPVQGGAADQMKLALIDFYHKCKAHDKEFPVVATIHDEVVLDVPEAEATSFKDLLVSSMMSAGESIYPGVTWKVDATIADTWAGKA